MHGPIKERLILQRALDKVAFLSFGNLVAQWCWKVYSGEVGPNDYFKKAA